MIFWRYLVYALKNAKVRLYSMNIPDITFLSDVVI